MRSPMNVEPPRFILVLAGIIHSDSRTRLDRTDVKLAVFDPQYARRQVLAVQFFVDRQGHAQLARSAGNVAIALRLFAEGPHAIDIFQWFDGPDQHGRRVSLGFGHRVQAKMETVNHVDVCKTGRAKHDRSAWGVSFRSVAGQIVRADISFRLDNLSCQAPAFQPAYQDLA